jgi:hypothetical protein
MKHIKLVLSLVLAGMLGFSTAAMSAERAPVKGVKPGVISAVALNKAGTYCHLKFPAIEPGTLSSAKPRLIKDPGSGDIVDFYGPCNYDPLGADEICRQQAVHSQKDSCD